LALAGCTPATVTVTEFVVPDVPEALRAPVLVPDRKAETLADVGLILTDHVEALGTANGRIVSIDCILDAAEAQEDLPCP